MTRRSLTVAALATIGMVCLIFVGCSDENIIITNAADGGGQTLSEIEQMYPAAVGYQTVFEVSYSNGSSEIVTNTVGEVVPFGYTTAHELHVRSSTGERYTNYFVFTDSALFFYEYWSDPPEKVLAAPLSYGTTWEKTDAVDLPANDNTDTTVVVDDNDPEIPKPGDDGGGAAAKNFPGNDAGTFTIEGTEALALSNGDLFSGVVRVRNDGGAATNYFWFAPGVGLIRWVLDADPTNRFEGAEVGELLDYGTNKF